MSYKTGFAPKNVCYHTVHLVEMSLKKCPIFGSLKQLVFPMVGLFIWFSIMFLCDWSTFSIKFVLFFCFDSCQLHYVYIFVLNHCAASVILFDSQTSEVHKNEIQYLRNTIAGLQAERERENQERQRISDSTTNDDTIDISDWGMHTLSIYVHLHLLVHFRLMSFTFQVVFAVCGWPKLVVRSSIVNWLVDGMKSAYSRYDTAPLFHSYHNCKVRRLHRR